VNWKVLKDGRQASEHKHYGEAEFEAFATGADEVYYLNGRGFGVTVWTRPADELPALIDGGSFL
jgi:hypothetical protein